MSGDAEGLGTSADDTVIRDATALSRRGRRQSVHPPERPAPSSPAAGHRLADVPDAARRLADVPDAAPPPQPSAIRRPPPREASHLLPRTAPGEVSVLAPARESVDGESVARAVRARTRRRAIIVLAGCVAVPAAAAVLLVLLQLH